MDKVFDELAELVGKTLARRWLNRKTTSTHQPVAEIDAHAAREAANGGVAAEVSEWIAQEPPHGA